ncbi:hypothetical protein M378DRAFT_188648 [Amanita muscaria Koide BX008]|uniref:DDE-1 domain-containing protein n=1 Tax=Amanita muscaria (strain Koide BX008) TaxID=946122 RepID=A0A0C2WI41_AMAMK|nr:hypothetical protein M378DRAFT_188648 [Amanita muscaria Koide BX008]
MYNMDEKGVQLGIGKRIAALVDRNQKVAQHIEAGDRELVTIIETVCADGSSLVPSVIFQGKRRNLDISVSEKGWTDQELGCLWIEKDFHPASSARNKINGYRLLVLDGHNSHCTYRFCKFAMQQRIVIVCLPAHTTHALQPCDVGVFGPLASCWKAEVLQAARDNTIITKSNLLHFYAKARSRAFKEKTIQAAFQKTGIWPLDPSAIPPEAFAPSQNTTTGAAQPLPAALPGVR